MHPMLVIIINNNETILNGTSILIKNKYYKFMINNKTTSNDTNKVI